MIEEMQVLYRLFSELPTSISVAFSAISALLAGWMYFKRVNIEERTSTTNIQKMQVTSLIEQIEMLSADLTLARQQIRQLHDQNMQLMIDLRAANQRIAAMEAALDRRKFGRRKYDPKDQQADGGADDEGPAPAAGDETQDTAKSDDQV